MKFQKLIKRIAYFIGRQEKLTNYTKDVKTYKWETSQIGRDFNFYAAIDSLNSTEFNELLNKYTEAFQSSLNNVTDATFIVEETERIAKTTSNWSDRKTAIDNMPKAGEPAIEAVERSAGDLGLPGIALRADNIDVAGT